MITNHDNEWRVVNYGREDSGGLQAADSESEGPQMETDSSNSIFTVCSLS